MTTASPRICEPTTRVPWQAAGQRMTLCHPVWRMSPGGLERQLAQLIERLPPDRFQNLLLVRGAAAGDKAVIRPNGDNVQILCDPSLGRDHLWGLRLATILQRHDVDVLHVRGLSMLVDAVLAARVAGNIPVVFSFHGLEDSAASVGHIRRLVLRSAVRQCAARWAVSRAAALALGERLRMDASIFELMPNGVDTTRFTAAVDRDGVRRQLGLDADRPVVLSVGNLKPVKGHDRLLSAIANLGGDAKNSAFVFIGEDHLGGTLQRLAADRLDGLDVRFLGRLDDVLPWYQAADIFVLPSRYEGLSNALLEAMACGLAIVATDAGGNAELIRHGQSGLLTPVDDEAALSAAIRFLLTDIDYRRALGAAACATVRDAHDIDRTVRCYAEGYEVALRISSMQGICNPEHVPTRRAVP